MSFLHCFLAVFAGLVVATIFTRVAFAVTKRVAEVPLLDFFVGLFTWIPWVAGWIMGGWPGVGAAVLAQWVFLNVFCAVDRLVRGKPGPTLSRAHAKLLGPVRNELALLVTAPAVLAFFMVRLGEILLYPPLAWLAKMPTYRTREWINLSRHKYEGLVGHDLVWCWYCDWMTGVWALGSEMLRNVESFWCPIRFCDDCKNRNVATDFPDVHKWCAAQGTVEDAVKVFEEHYDGRRKNSWWGHPDRKKP
mgnify:CR=1 FL=1